MKRIGFVCLDNPNDRNAWSGALFSMLQALRSRYEVDVISFHPPFWAGVLDKFVGGIKGKRHSVLYASDSAARQMGEKLSRLTKGKGYSCLFAVAAENVMAYYNGTIPYVFINNAVFADMADNYRRDLDYATIRNGKRHDKRALSRAAAILFSSEWAKESAHRRYGINPRKIYSVPFGANIPVPSFLREKTPGDPVRLLFVGTDWRRKGGETALQTLRALRKMCPARRFILNLAGSRPMNIQSEEGVFFHGFLNKTDRFELVTLRELYAAADIFILPSRAEGPAIALCEASAYGLPALCYDTGGLSDYVVNGKNGWRLPVGSHGGDFADRVLELLENPLLYRDFSLRARQLYEEKLCWNAWLASASEIADSLSQKER